MGEILLIRHGKTAGNLQGRYIGSRTDEPLCPEGVRELEERSCPPADRVYISPMKRCAQTARILWPGCEPVPVPGLKECDFGAFENRNYEELNGDPDYQAWIDSGGTLAFPGGESPEEFRKRCREAFEQVLRSLRQAGGEDGPSEVGEAPGCSDAWSCPAGFAGRAAIVAHGGTIMAILETYGFPKKDYFDFQVKNGCGFLLTPVEGTDLWNYQYLP